MIAIGSDHAGFNLKYIIIQYLESKGYKYIDFGTNSSESVDYPDFAQKVTESIITAQCDKGILICGTGIGISIAANKVPGIRAALCTDSFMAKMSREHNNSNVLALGARVLGDGLALDIIETWLSSDFTEGKHTNRINKISSIEQKYKHCR